MSEEEWRRLARSQAGLISRAQLAALGIDRFRVRNQIAAERWTARSPTVLSITTGELTRRQSMWLGVLHGGRDALVGDLTAAELAGLRNWHRDDLTILIPDRTTAFDEITGIRFVRTRRPLPRMRSAAAGPPALALEPAILHFGAYQRSRRTAQGVIAAAVQQGLTTPDSLMPWIRIMRPLRWAGLFRQTIGEIAGGAQSVAELDVNRMCRTFGLRPPRRQTKRRDSAGRLRFTDCEWRLPDGTVVILEVDGSFHLDVQHWEDDIARQRALSAPGRIVVRCTARELREEPERVAGDLQKLLASCG